MEVDVEQGDARRALIDERLRRDRGVVDEAVTAEHVRRGVVPGRAAQRERFARAPPRSAACAVSATSTLARAASQVPFADRGLGRQRVVAELAVDMLRNALTAYRAPASRWR